MLFKSECNKFLDTITAMRSTAITTAIEEAIKNEHVPYAEQMVVARNAVIEEEKQKTAELIKTLQADLERKINSYTEETDKAIADNKKRVSDVAEAKAKAAYDGFILGVGKLVDETKID